MCDVHYLADWSSADLPMHVCWVAPIRRKAGGGIGFSPHVRHVLCFDNQVRDAIVDRHLM